MSKTNGKENNFRKITNGLNGLESASVTDKEVNALIFLNLNPMGKTVELGKSIDSKILGEYKKAGFFDFYGSGDERFKLTSKFRTYFRYISEKSDFEIV